MPRSQATVRIARPVDVVFAGLVGHAWRNDPAWEAEVVEVRPEGPGPLGVGSRIAMTRKESGKVFTTTFVVTDFETPRRIGGYNIGGPMGFAIDFVVRPAGAGASDVTVTVDIGLRGAMRIATPLFALYGPRRNARISRQMAAAIEAANPAPTSTTVVSPAAVATD